jgi:hypothetical protein
MDAGILDLLVGAFFVALDGAYGTLFRYALPLLGILGTMYLLLAVGRLMTGSASLDALSEFLWIVLKCGALVWLVSFLYDIMWNGAFMTFLQCDDDPHRV